MKRTLCNRHPLTLLDKTQRNPVHQLIAEIKQQEQEDPQQIILCTQCGNPITREQEKTAINQSVEHLFTNPYGYIFHIICFKEALGCTQEGHPVAADTWFPGHFWRYALCGHCNIHLGWHYTSSLGDCFYGLIKDRLCTASKPH